MGIIKDDMSDFEGGIVVGIKQAGLSISENKVFPLIIIKIILFISIYYYICFLNNNLEQWGDRYAIAFTNAILQKHT